MRRACDERVGTKVCSEEVGTPFLVLHSSRAVSGDEMIKNVGGGLFDVLGVKCEGGSNREKGAQLAREGDVPSPVDLSSIPQDLVEKGQGGSRRDR